MRIPCKWIADLATVEERMGYFEDGEEIRFESVGGNILVARKVAAKDPKNDAWDFELNPGD